MTSVSFARMASTTATTKRNPAKSSSKIGVPVSNLTAFAILPPMPVSQQISEYYRLESPRESYVTYTQAATDVLEGDVLTTGGLSYRVIAAAPWPTDRAYLEIVMTLAKGT